MNRYCSDGDRLSQLEESTREIAVSLKSSQLSEEVAKKLTPLIRQLASRDGGSDEGLSIGSIISNFVDCVSTTTIDRKSIETTYALLFGTSGDESNEFDAEFNEVRDSFRARFGELCALGLSAYLSERLHADWERGITEAELSILVHRAFIAMVMISMHKDISQGGQSLILGFTDDGEMKGRAVDIKKAPNPTVQTTAPPSSGL